MQCERFIATADPDESAARLRSLVPGAETVREGVAEIIETVRARGDAAVLEYTRRLDAPGAESLRVDEAELEQAAGRLDSAIREALAEAIENVRRVAELAATESQEVDLESHTVKVSRIPVARAAIYVPGGRASYPSTVVMGVVPARSAGVGEVVVCSPPRSDGEIDPVVLATCRLAGASTVYRMGGAQAIAALAYGTESVTPVDVIVGPGNLWVQEAKRQVYGQVGVDGFAGPSDLVVIAASDADPELVALDLLAQAEHGPGTLVAALSSSAELLEALAGRLEASEETGAAAGLVQVDDATGALAISEALGPEHLQLMGAQAEELADRVTRAGCVFVGMNAGTAFGDYVAGSNHILPTEGTARFASGVSPLQFLRVMAQVRIEAPDQLARWGAAIARVEGFERHARSMEARIRQNRPDAR